MPSNREVKAMDLKEFFEGNMCNAYEYFGAHIENDGVVFRTYAPHAQNIYVIGEFNDWTDSEESKMKRIDERGVYELFIAGAKKGQLYKFRIIQALGNTADKADPYAFYSQLRPDTASVIEEIHTPIFKDSKWMKKRTRNLNQPMNIYEMHFGSWKKPQDGRKWFNYDEIADELIDYVKKMNYTHVEFMPLNEYPFDGSWGYQTSGYFSVTSRYGKINDLKKLINRLHQNDIGVIMDFVPVHFVKDNYSLNYFDGTPLYEYDNDNDANSQWGTSNFNLWREEVRSFLMSAANFWLDIFHVDGLRMDAIANMIFWQGNKDKGVNEGALYFIKRMNNNLHKLHPEVFLIAEDSSDFPKVCAPAWDGGLEFDYKWDLGWMHDTLKYLEKDPIYRQYHHNQVTFSMAYFYSEKFIMPLSHDEVVHGKHTIVDKMWGNYEQKFAQARTLYMYMMTHPGKKLNFMGNEIAQFREWDEEKENDWFMLEYPMHDSFSHYIADLNKLVVENPAFYELDYTWEGFKWIDADNKADNMFIYQRMNEDQKFIIVLNFSPNHYANFRIGVEKNSTLKEVLNTDTDIYSGSNIRNKKALRTKKVPHNFLDYSCEIEIAPFSGIIFEVKEIKSKKSE